MHSCIVSSWHCTNWSLSFGFSLHVQGQEWLISVFICPRSQEHQQGAAEAVVTGRWILDLLSSFGYKLVSKLQWDWWSHTTPVTQHRSRLYSWRRLRREHYSVPVFLTEVMTWSSQCQALLACYFDGTWTEKNLCSPLICTCVFSLKGKDTIFHTLKYPNSTI